MNQTPRVGAYADPTTARDEPLPSPHARVTHPPMDPPMDPPAEQAEDVEVVQVVDAPVATPGHTAADPSAVYREKFVSNDDKVLPTDKGNSLLLAALAGVLGVVAAVVAFVVAWPLAGLLLAVLAVVLAAVGLFLAMGDVRASTITPAVVLAFNALVALVALIWWATYDPATGRAVAPVAPLTVERDVVAGDGIDTPRTRDPDAPRGDTAVNP